jgi:hypothetical protein
MLLPNDYPSQILIEALERNPLSKASIKIYLDCLSSSQGYLDKTIFNRLRRRLEVYRGSHFDFRSRLDRAEAGRYIAWGELSYRKELPAGWQPPSFNLQLSPKPSQPSPKVNDPLKEHWHFTKLLKQGRILNRPSTFNGMEKTPLFQVFGNPTTLDELNGNYRTLRMKHHPDVSPYSQSEAEERFHWLGQAYRKLCDNWSRFDPRSQEIPKERVNSQLTKRLKFQNGWWYWKERK